MLKQLSISQKIFCAITLLFGICYVGVLIYVQQAFAGDPEWVQYNATVINIQLIDSGSKTYGLNTEHPLKYDNTANAQSKTVRIKGKATWFKNGVSQNPIDDRTTSHTAAASSIGWVYTYRYQQMNITNGDDWLGQAYTNLLQDDWDNNVIGPGGVNTIPDFDHNSYEAGGVTPETPRTNTVFAE